MRNNWRSESRGTTVLPVVTVGKQRTLLPSFQVSAPGAYRLATAHMGAEIGAYLTSPVGATIRLRVAQILRRYQYDGEVLTLYGEFTDGPVFVYRGISLTPMRAVAKQGRVEVAMKASNSPVTVTVYQGGGVCDSMVVSLRAAVQVQ